jgi:hypothetical protein
MVWFEGKIVVWAKDRLLCGEHGVARVFLNKGSAYRLLKDDYRGPIASVCRLYSINGIVTATATARKLNTGRVVDRVKRTPPDRTDRSHTWTLKMPSSCSQFLLSIADKELHPWKAA